jgi:hypothetical protein
MNEIEQAKKTLRDAGYFTDNLWHIDDVKQNYDCDNETALEILDNALTNDKTTEHIFNCIDDIIDYKYRTT